MQHALGEIKPASVTTALRATNNQSSPTRHYSCQALKFQALAANTGSVFIVDRETPSLTQNVLAEIPAPSTTPVTRPAWTIGNPAGVNPLDASTFWILPAVSGEGVRVTVVST